MCEQQQPVVEPDDGRYSSKNPAVCNCFDFAAANFNQGNAVCQIRDVRTTPGGGVLKWTRGPLEPPGRNAEEITHT